MMDWNYLILSRIKKILSSISSTQKLIGTTTDIDGDSTKGTLMAKENAILSAISKMAEEQLWGRWTFSSSVSASFNLDAGRQEIKTVTIPAKSWFSCIQISEAASAGTSSDKIRMEVTIRRKTYNMDATIIAGKQYPTYFMFTYMGLQMVHNVVKNENIQDSSFPLVPEP